MKPEIKTHKKEKDEVKRKPRWFQITKVGRDQQPNKKKREKARLRPDYGESCLQKLTTLTAATLQGMER